MSSSVIHFPSCLQSFPASVSFPMSQFFESGGQSVGASASASVLPMNIQDWFPLELTGLISLQSKGLSRVFSNTTVQKHQFFSTGKIRHKIRKKRLLRKQCFILLQVLSWNVAQLQVPKGFSGGSVVKNLPANAGNAGSIPGSRRSSGEGNGNPLQYSCLENSMDRGTW